MNASQKNGYSVYRKSVELQQPAHYSLRATVLSHGWVHLPPFEYDPRSNVLSWAFTLENGGSYRAAVSEGSGRIIVRLSPKTTDASLLAVRRVLCLDWITDGLLKRAERFSSRATELVKRGAGRLLRGSTLWEDLAKTLMTTNCSWSKTQSMTANLCKDTVNSVNEACFFPSAEMVYSCIFRHE